MDMRRLIESDNAFEREMRRIQQESEQVKCRKTVWALLLFANFAVLAIAVWLVTYLIRIF